MSTTNTAVHGLAVAAGMVFATGTLGILFSDVLSQSATFTLKHYLTLVIVAGTMMAGHLADQARRHRQWVSLFGFSLVFFAGTGLVVYNSVGRQAEKSMMTAAEHDDVVQRRNELKAKLASEVTALLDKRVIADRRCAKDKDGAPCRNARAVESVYADSAAGTEARLEKLTPPKPVEAEAEEFATVAAALGHDKEQVKALALLLSPFLQTLFLEFGTIVSFSFAFSSKRQEVEQRTVRRGRLNSLTFAANPKLPNCSTNCSGPAPLDNGHKVARYTKGDAAADLAGLLASGERFGSQDALAKRYGVAKSTMSEWLREWESSGLVPLRIQEGRRKALSS